MSDTSPVILGDENRLINEFADTTLQEFFDANPTQFLSDVGAITATTAFGVPEGVIHIESQGGIVSTLAFGTTETVLNLADLGNIAPTVVFGEPETPLFIELDGIASTLSTPQVQFVRALIGGANKDVGGIASTTTVSENIGFQGGIFRALIYKQGEISGIGSTESMFVAGGIRFNPSSRTTPNEQFGTEVSPNNPNTFISINISGEDKKIPVYNSDAFFNTSESSVDLSSVEQSIIPSANITYDLGTSELRWRDLYLSGDTIDLAGTKVSVTSEGDIEFKDASDNPKKIIASEIEIGTGDNKIKLQRGNNGKLKVFDKNDQEEAFNLSQNNTDELAEGDVNFYYTNDRVASYLSSNGYDTATNIVASIVDSAPETLNTLNELAESLGDDANFATTVTNNLSQKLGATATVTLSGDITGSATFSANAVTVDTVDTNLANTNAYIASVASDLDTQEAKQASDLANTNAYIASVASDLDTQEAKQASDLANTNAYIASVSSSQTQYLQVSNTVTEIETALGSVSADIIPSSSATYDLGSATNRWQNIYTSDLNLNNGIGDYTVVEGEEDLFLYNNKSGKVFKFALIEVQPEEATPKIDDLRRQ